MMKMQVLRKMPTMHLQRLNLSIIMWKNTTFIQPFHICLCLAVTRLLENFCPIFRTWKLSLKNFPNIPNSPSKPQAI